MKKIIYVWLVTCLVLLGACTTKTGNEDLETVIYSHVENGISSNVEIRYDKEKNVQETVTTNRYNYEKIGMEEEYLKEYIDAASSIYNGMEGVTRSVDYGENEAIEQMIINVNEVSKESLPVLFSTNVNDDGIVSLINLTDSFKQAGYVEKE